MEEKYISTLPKIIQILCSDFSELFKIGDNS